MGTVEEKDLMPTTFDIKLRDGSGSVEILDADFIAQPTMAFYFSLITSFSSRGASFMVDSKKYVLTATDTDDGDMLDDDFSPGGDESGTAKEPLSRAAFGEIIRALGLFIAGESTLLQVENPNRYMVLKKRVMTKFTSLMPAGGWTETKLEDGFVALDRVFSNRSAVVDAAHN